MAAPLNFGNVASFTHSNKLRPIKEEKPATPAATPSAPPSAPPIHGHHNGLSIQLAQNPNFIWGPAEEEMLRRRRAANK